MIERVTNNQTQIEYDQVICDVSKIILEDHVCLYPGYVTVSGNRYWQNFSEDPNNRFSFPASDPRMQQDPSYQQWVKDGMLKNRKEFRVVKEVNTLPEGSPEMNGMHFTDLDTMLQFMRSHPVESTIDEEEPVG